jgi:feruloyl esterase
MSIPAPAIVGKPNGEYLFGQEFLRYFVYNDPTYGIHSFNFETDINDLFPTSRLLDATDTNLRPFKAQGGKMIIYHGWADAAIPPLGTIDYY